MTENRISEKISSMCSNSYKIYRWGVGLVMLLVGVHKIFSPEVWASYMAPQFVSLFKAFGISSTLFMQINSIVEIAFGLAILFDFYTVISAAVVSLSFLGIIVNLVMANMAAAGTGNIDIIIRDIGLLFMAAGLTVQAANRKRGDML